MVEEVLPRRWVRRVCPTLQRLVRPHGEPREAGLPTKTAEAFAEGDTWMRVMAKILVETDRAPAALANALVLGPEELSLLRVLDQVRFLKNLRLFTHLPVIYLGAVADALEPMVVRGGTTLFEEGDYSENIYLIESGAVRIDVDGVDVAFLPAGESLGELSVLDGSPRSATVVTIGTTRLLRLSGDRFRALLLAHGSIARALMSTLDARIRETLALATGSGRSETPMERKLARSTLTELPDLQRMVSIVSFLQQVELFADLPVPCLISLARIVREVTALKGEVLFEQGDVGRTLYLICSGAVSIRVGSREVARLQKNATFGGMSLISGRRRSAAAVVRHDARLLQIWSEEFHSLVTTEPSFALALLRTLAQRLRHVSTTVLEAHESDWGSMS